MNKVACAFILATWLGGLGYAHYRLSSSISTTNKTRAGIVLPPFSQFDPRLINVFTLGHRGAYDDFLHIWLNHFLVDSTILQRNPEATIALGDIVLNLRPTIETSYLLACIVFTQDVKHPEFCEPIIQTGMKVFPKSFMLPMAQGYVSYKLLNDPSRAAVYYAIAAQSEKAPPHLTRVAKKMLDNQMLDESEIEQMTFDFKNMFGKQALLDLLKQKAEEKR